MHLIQIFLPLYDNEGHKFPARIYAAQRKTLVEKFGGMTAHSQAPVKGLWKDKGRTKRDQLVIFEIMVKRVERPWWMSYRRRLERTFKQKEIVLRAQRIIKL